MADTPLQTMLKTAIRAGGGLLARGTKAVKEITVGDKYIEVSPGISERAAEVGAGKFVIPNGKHVPEFFWNVTSAIPVADLVYIITGNRPKVKKQVTAKTNNEEEKEG